MAPKTIEQISDTISQYIMFFNPTITELCESTLIIDRFTMTTWQQGRLLKCESYFTAYPQQTELYALSSRVVFVLNPKTSHALHLSQ